jgi:hypothetical protein
MLLNSLVKSLNLSEKICLSVIGFRSFINSSDMKKELLWDPSYLYILTEFPLKNKNSESVLKIKLLLSKEKNIFENDIISTENRLDIKKFMPKNKKIVSVKIQILHQKLIKFKHKTIS